MMPRFSKAVLTETVQQRLDFIQAIHGFDPGNGTAQLKGKLGNVRRCCGSRKSSTPM
jgi:hypothetical protein